MKMKRKPAVCIRFALAGAWALALAGCEMMSSEGLGADRNHAIYLFQDSFQDGNLVKDGEQWFSMTVTSAETYYIHCIFGTLKYLNVRVFNRNGSPVGGEVYLREWMDAWSFSQEFLDAGTYYIRVCPLRSGDSGDYRIAFNTSAKPPQ